jgi:hypothetical protein
MNTQLCKNCNTTKVLEIDFYKSKITKTGYMYTCKRCIDIKKTIYDKNNRPINNNKLSTWRKRNPEKALLKGSRASAKRRGLDYNLDLEDIVIPEFCPVLGIKLVINDNRPKDNSATIDRIDNSKGYIKGNVQVISWRANRGKSDLDATEHLKIAEYIKSHSKLASAFG